MPIIGFSGKYEVNKDGLVRNKNTGRILKPQKNRKGYLVVYLSNYNVNKKKHTCFIHRLVAKAFIPNPNNLPQINHIDGNKENNKIHNLEWCDNSYNQIHAWENGFQYTVSGHLESLDKIHKRNRKFSGEQVRKIRAMHTDGLSLSELGRQFGVSSNSISKIVNRITYKEVD